MARNIRDFERAGRAKIEFIGKFFGAGWYFGVGSISINLYKGRCTPDADSGIESPECVLIEEFGKKTESTIDWTTGNQNRKYRKNEI